MCPKKESLSRCYGVIFFWRFDKRIAVEVASKILKTLANFVILEKLFKFRKNLVFIYSGNAISLKSFFKNFSTNKDAICNIDCGLMSKIDDLCDQIAKLTTTMKELIENSGKYILKEENFLFVNYYHIIHKRPDNKIHSLIGFR